MYANICVDKGVPRYLKQESLRKIEKGKGIMTQIKLRCGNMEKSNKYVSKEERRCRFCKEAEDNIWHYIENYDKVKGWFTELGESVEIRYSRLWNDELDANKDRILRKLWTEKDKLKNDASQEVGAV